MENVFFQVLNERALQSQGDKAQWCKSNALMPVLTLSFAFLPKEEQVQLIFTFINKLGYCQTDCGACMECAHPQCKCTVCALA